MIKFSEETTWKTEIDKKVDLLCQTLRQVMNAKETFLKEIKSTTPVNTLMVRKWALLQIVVKVFMMCIEEQTSHNIPLS